MKIAVFFTREVSLETWANKGMFSREVKFYEELAEKIGEIYFFTYGKNDLKYQKRLKNIKIFPKKVDISDKLYEFLMPFFYRNQLKKVDALRTHQMLGSFSAIISKFLYGKKLIVRCGYQWSKFLKNMKINRTKRFLAYLIELITYKCADKIILTSEKDKNYVQKKYKIKEEFINVVPNYIDTCLFRPLKIKKRENSLCFVGRLNEQKNLFNLLEAIKGIDVSLTIIGSGPQENELKNFVKKNNLRVIFKGNIENKQLPKELNQHEIFILPSLYEGNPKALLEAMSCEMPVIGTNVEGIKEIIKHKENSYLCSTDAESLKKAIQEVLKNKDLQKKMGKNARKTVLEKFELKKIVKEEIKVYENLL